MGKLKDLLLELEEQGVIIWIGELGYYVLAEGDQTVPFDFVEYLAKVHK